MKIEVVSFTGDSGLADYSVSLARALSAHTKTAVVTARTLPVRFDNMGFEVHRVFRRSRHYPIDIVRFAAGVLRRKPNWIILQGPLKFVGLDALVVRALRILRINVAITVHDVLPHYPRPWSRLLFGFYYRSFQRVIVHSEAAHNGVRALGVQGDVLVVPHGIYDIFDLTGITRTNALLRVGQLSDSDFVVLFFGNLEPRKGLRPFLEAAKSMQGNSTIKFLLAGANTLPNHDPVYAAELETARKAPNVLVHDRRIAFEDVENYFMASNVVALPYLEGTTSGVLKLALAFGKPVIATRVGDFPEQVPNGAGLFVENDDSLVLAFCQAITTIRQQEGTFKTAMHTASDRAAWPDIAKRVIQHLQST